MIIVRDGLAWKVQKDGYQVTVSPGEAATEIDRLRAENAELRKDIEGELDHSKIMFTADEKRLRNAIGAILAKTAKEGE